MRSLLFTLACVALVGCGQTGNLYLPDKEAEVVGSPAPAAGTDAPDSTAEAESKRNEAQRQPAPQ